MPAKKKTTAKKTAAKKAAPRKKAPKKKKAAPKAKSSPKTEAPNPESDPENDFLDGLWEDASAKAQNVADDLKKRWKKAAAHFQKAADKASKTAQEVLEDAHQVANRASVLRKATGVINIVVYDKTETQPPSTFPNKIPKKIGNLKDISPFSLTFWWKTGGKLNQMDDGAEILIGATTWKGALQSIVRELRKRSDDKKATIGSLQFWGHGTDGAMLIGDTSLGADDFEEGSPFAKQLSEIREHLDPKQGSVWFRGSHTFRGKEGHGFAEAAAGFFKTPVVGHTYLIWLLQSGTQILKPGKRPDWLASQGKGRVNAPWSDASRPLTVSLLKQHPPTRSLEFISRKNLEKCTNKVIDYTKGLFSKDKK